MFFIEFLTWYSQLSIMSLIKDIFAGEINIIKYDLQKTVDLYKASTIKNINNFFNLIPFFVSSDSNCIASLFLLVNKKKKKKRKKVNLNLIVLQLHNFYFHISNYTY